MSDKPIIFSAPMVRALLDGTKTQTRRVFVPQPRTRPELVEPPSVSGKAYWAVFNGDEEAGKVRVPYAPGDRLWVREAFSYDRLDVDRDGTLPPWHWADGNPSSGDWSKPKPSIHMPRWASRLTLTVTNVRVERLQEISEADAAAEGVWGRDEKVEAYGPRAGRSAFRTLWSNIHGHAAWSANPWVAAYTFTVQRGNIDTLEAAE